MLPLNRNGTLATKIPDTIPAKMIIETYARATDINILYPLLPLKTPEHFWIEYCAPIQVAA